MPGKINTDKPMRARPVTDLYNTPAPVAAAALRYLFERPAPGDQYEQPVRVLDPGSGNGVWGREARALLGERAHIVGCELEDRPPDPAYTWWRCADFLTQNWPMNFDFICGNPPYSLAEQFVRRGVDQLAPSGTLMYLLKLDFLASATRVRGLYADPGIVLTEVSVLANRPSFFDNGSTNAYEHGLFFFRRRRGGEGEPTITWLDWKVGSATRRSVR
jgi:hypothetical protein